MRTVVLITGYARAGKGTFANAMLDAAKEQGYIEHLNFADCLKLGLNEMLATFGQLSDATDFFNERFKAQHRDVLVTAGRFARSLDRNVFAKSFCNRITDFRFNSHIVCSDWRYLNELQVVKNDLGKTHRIITVRVNTVGIEAANEEEGLSIGEITREVPIDYEYTFMPNGKTHIEAEGRELARRLGL